MTVLLWLRNREREFLVRLALGAGRGRVFRQVLVEMALVAIVGGADGIVAAAVGIRTFASVNASSIAGDLSGATDWRVAAIGGLTVLVLMCVVSLAAALVVSRTTPASIVRGTASRSRRATATNSTLVVAQIACAVVILVAASSAALLTNRLARVELGYDNACAIVFEVTLPRVRYADRFAIGSFTDELIARLQALPGVTSVGATNLASGGQAVLLGTTLALTGADGASAPRESDGEEDGHRDTAIAMSATPGYLRGLGVPLIAGRYFDLRDTSDGPRVAIVTVAAARPSPGSDQR